MPDHFVECLHPRLQPTKRNLFLYDFLLELGNKGSAPPFCVLAPSGRECLQECTRPVFQTRPEGCDLSVKLIDLVRVQFAGRLIGILRLHHITLDLQLCKLLLQQADIRIVRLPDHRSGIGFLALEFQPIRSEVFPPGFYVHFHAVSFGFQARKLIHNLVGLRIEGHDPGHAHIPLKVRFRAVQRDTPGLQLCLEEAHQRLRLLPARVKVAFRIDFHVDVGNQSGFLRVHAPRRDADNVRFPDRRKIHRLVQPAHHSPFTGRALRRPPAPLRSKDRKQDVVFAVSVPPCQECPRHGGGGRLRLQDFQLVRDFIGGRRPRHVKDRKGSFLPFHVDEDEGARLICADRSGSIENVQPHHDGERDEDDPLPPVEDPEIIPQRRFLLQTAVRPGGIRNSLIPVIFHCRCPF